MKKTNRILSVFFRYSHILLILSLVAFYGCWSTKSASTVKSPSFGEILQAGVYGPRILTEPSLTWITNPLQLARIYNELEKNQISSASPEIPKIDFSTSGVLLIEMGLKLTGGYSLEFSSELSHVIGDRAVISTSWNVPDDNAVVAQVLTSPFLLLKLNRTDFTYVLVVDQKQKEVLKIAVH